ncbi:thermonuclease family protein [Microbacterium hominis]|uniref:Thermonuclease family protein n=1 Tax=Microbacterium hominis TaxID=162426 RepID=A0A7D4PT95_9MICO|nr:thermonuclease family protein [Microbacterium hominis]QKJ18414.1 thermonuclease family protein [Microbacterium hominis]
MKRVASAVAVVLVAIAIIVGVIWYSQVSSTVGDTAVSGDVPSFEVTLPSPPADAFEMTVMSVHDGDTLRAVVATPNDIVTTTESTRIRLLGIDTPEISPELECWGAEATDALTALAPPGSTIIVAPDRDPFDQYGRNLLYLWTAEGEFINARLVADGAARVEIYSPNDLHEELLRGLEADAAAADLGRWGACS